VILSGKLQAISRKKKQKRSARRWPWVQCGQLEACSLKLAAKKKALFEKNFNGAIDLGSLPA
jgi:hypothetical protein